MIWFEKNLTDSSLYATSLLRLPPTFLRLLRLLDHKEPRLLAVLYTYAQSLHTFSFAYGINEYKVLFGKKRPTVLEMG